MSDHRPITGASRRRRIAWALVAAGWSLLAGKGAVAANVPSFGYLEIAHVYPGPVALQAKLDTGADNSSLHSSFIQRVNRDGRWWVLFEVENRLGETVRMERPLVRVARVKRPSGDVEERPVVRLDICLGDIRREVEVNLSDRSNFAYRMLIGRSFLAGSVLVDTARTFTVEPDCDRAQPEATK